MESAKHSAIGIASFITSLTFFLLMFVSVAAADILATVMPAGIGEQATAAIMLGLSLTGALVALRLGVGGISQEADRKIFAVLGVVLSTGTILGIGLIMAVGFSASGAAS